MVTPIPHYNISYAQNFEDIFLAGILKDIENGFYVDVGANHPVQDSVTKIQETIKELKFVLIVVCISIARWI